MPVKRPPAPPSWREFLFVFLVLIFPFGMVIAWLSAHAVVVLIAVASVSLAYLAARRWTAR
jgi:hypothetical protein